MKFRSRRDLVFTLVVFGINLFVTSIFCYRMICSDSPHILWTDPLLIAVGGLLLWVYFGTHYQLSEQTLSYRSGPIKGQIETARIREVVVGKTLWLGFKPATASKGIIVKYDNYSELYISPESNELFVEQLLRLSKDIKITTIKR